MAKTYTVNSQNSGAIVCGPYSKKAEAERECKRLNGEAHSGRGAPTEEEPEGQLLSGAPGDIIRHRGEAQRYEVLTHAPPSSEPAAVTDFPTAREEST